MAHRLDSLLRPKSVAVVGATVRESAVGNYTIRNLLRGGFGGELFAVNPRYSKVCGVPCYAALEDLPQKVEHVIFCVSDERIEQVLDAAIERGVRAATIMSALVLSDDERPLLKDRVASRARNAGLLVCGGNGMGFYNFSEGVWACGFDTRSHKPPGNVTLISHSGAAMSGIVDVDERINFNLAVSTGQELCVSMDEYMDFALDLPETRVIGLFIETARNPAGLVAALEKANDRGVPVVAIKVGRTELAARLAVSHSGAMAGSDSAFDALFDRHGVQRVEDMEELATALIMFAQPHEVAPGGLVFLHDSGGERQLAIDLADTVGVGFAELSAQTVSQLEGLLDPGLPAVNPLDAWSTGGPDYHRVMGDCLAALMSDPDAALGAVIHDRAPHGRLYAEYLEYLKRGHEASGKPAFLVSNRQGTGSDAAVIDWTEQGFPVLDGLRSFLAGARCLVAHRDFHARPQPALPSIDEGAIGRSRGRLSGADALSEHEALTLLADFGIQTSRSLLADTEEAAVDAARGLGLPVVLKTAEPGIAHKTDAGGVALNLGSESSLRQAYREVAAKLGPRVLVAPMVKGSVEMMLGMVRDVQFGPLVMIGMGGVHVELLRDVVWALPPVDADGVSRLVDRLMLRPLLDGSRGQPAVNVRAFCEAAARFSMLAAELGDLIAEIDVNPVVLGPEACVAVDALAILESGATDR